jgi:hypothetical protein
MAVSPPGEANVGVRGRSIGVMSHVQTGWLYSMSASAGRSRTMREIGSTLTGLRR